MKLRTERSTHKGSFGVVDKSGLFRPFIFNGQTIDSEGPVWFFEAAHDLGIGLYVVEWRNVDSKIALHYYSSDLNYIGNSFEQLPNDVREILTSTVLETVSLLYHKMTTELMPNCPTISCLFGEIPISLRLEIITNNQAWPAQSTQVVASDARSLDNWPVISWPHLRAIFDIDFLAAQASAFYGADLNIPSPFSGELLTPKSGMFVHYNQLTCSYAYRFSDIGTGLVFYVLCADNNRTKHSNWCYSIHAVFIPSVNIILYSSLDAKNYFEYFFWEPMEIYFYKEIASYGEFLLPNIAASRPRYAAAIYFKHIGHHLWNELTGLDLICRFAVASPQSAPIFVVQSKSTEMFGRLEYLFPELKSPIDRSAGSFPELKALFYRSNYILLHPSHHHVSARLAGRIITWSDEACGDALSRQYDDLAGEGYHIVLIGLRVENRTLVDLFGFCLSVIEEISRSFAKVAIVIDGHNRPADVAEAMSFQSLHSRNSYDLDATEEAIFCDLRDHFSLNSKIRFISTLRQPVAASIFWCSRASFFICPWGAGLAKYKWVCNKPGLLVSSQSFLSNYESKLYDMEDYRENCIISHRIDAAEAIDHPEVPTLVPSGKLNFNFSVNSMAVIREIRRLVGEFQ